MKWCPHCRKHTPTVESVNDVVKSYHCEICHLFIEDEDIKPILTTDQQNKLETLSKGYAIGHAPRQLFKKDRADYEELVRLGLAVKTQSAYVKVKG